MESLKTRSLSTVGLLATATINPNNNDGIGGELHFVDTTGIIKCRAYAIGKHSSLINERLSKEQFHELSVEEGAQRLLDIVTDCSKGASMNINDNEVVGDEEGDDESWQIPSGTFVEIAVIDSTQMKVRRLRQPLILSTTKSS